MRNKIFWIFTVLFSLFMLYSGYSEIADPAGVKVITDLGYPAYFSAMLGFAKILGALALLAQRKFPHLAEWAYAGFTFDILAAVYSMYKMGAGVGSLVPVLFLIPLVISRCLRPGGCRCGAGACAA
jgi:hypothetical protein